MPAVLSLAADSKKLESQNNKHHTNRNIPRQSVSATSKNIKMGKLYKPILVSSNGNIKEANHEESANESESGGETWEKVEIELPNKVREEAISRYFNQRRLKYHQEFRNYLKMVVFDGAVGGLERY